MLAGFSKYDFRNLGEILSGHIFFSKNNILFSRHFFSKHLFFVLVTTAFWNLVTKPTGGRFSNEIPKRYCNEREKINIFKLFFRKKSENLLFGNFCLENFFEKNQKNICPLRISPRFRKSHL